MKNHPFLNRLMLLAILASSLVYGCQQSSEPPNQKPKGQLDSMPDPSGEVDLDPEEDLVAFSWNGEFFEEQQFPAHQTEALFAYATPLEFDAPREAMATRVNDNNLIFEDLSNGNSYLHNLESFPRIYMVNSGGRRKVFIPCKNGSLLNQSFGSGNTILVSGMDGNAERKIVNMDGGITTILIATDISDDQQFFFSRWTPGMINQMAPIGENESSNPTGTGDCTNHTALVEEVEAEQVDLALCGNYLTLVGTNSNGESSCRATIDLNSECSFCISRSTITDSNGITRERFLVFAESSCSENLLAFCFINKQVIPL